MAEIGNLGRIARVVNTPHTDSLLITPVPQIQGKKLYSFSIKTDPLFY